MTTKQNNKKHNQFILLYDFIDKVTQTRNLVVATMSIFQLYYGPCKKAWSINLY